MFHARVDSSSGEVLFGIIHSNSSLLSLSYLLSAAYPSHTHITVSIVLISTVMVIHILTTLLLPPAAWLLYTVWCIVFNYRIARRVGVPIVVIPISPENLLWIIVGKYLLPYFERLPFGNGTFTRFCRYGWQISDNGRAHRELGDAFITVTPGKNWLYVCNPEAVLDIFQRGSDFPRKVEIVGTTIFRTWLAQHHM